MNRPPLTMLAVMLSIGLISQQVLAKSALENTKRNVRDESGATLTPDEQGENKGDIRITADIRKAIMDDKGLSLNAQNIKIITKNGFVTLRGPVETPTESVKLGTVASKVAGVTRVDNQLEVKTN